jgi:hypothetical protein
MDVSYALMADFVEGLIAGNAAKISWTLSMAFKVTRALEMTMTGREKGSRRRYA